MNTCRVTSAAQHQGGLRLSPDSRHLAYLASSTKVYVSEAPTTRVIATFTAVDKIDRLEWSPDSNFVLCAMFSRCSIQVFDIYDKTWNCRINEGPAGIINARWCPDSRHILVESDFGLQISVWSLVDCVPRVFTHPKAGMTSVAAFSDCGMYMAIGHRIELQDYIGVYSTHPWSELSKFKCRTNDLAQLAFVPSTTLIFSADSSLCYRVSVYSPSGEVIAHFEPYENALGSRVFAFQRSSATVVVEHADSLLSASMDLSDANLREKSSSAQGLLAIGSYDGKVRVFSSRSWEMAFVLPQVHTKELANYPSIIANVKTTVEVEAGKYSGGTVFETDIWGSTTDGDSTILNQSISLNSTTARSNSYIYKNLKSLPKLSSSEIRAAKSIPKMGVNSLQWAPESALLAVREESYPRCLWIWNGLEAKLVALLVQMQSVLSAQWKPTPGSAVLAYCTGTERVYIWTEAGPSWVCLFIIILPS